MSQFTSAGYEQFQAELTSYPNALVRTDGAYSIYNISIQQGSVIQSTEGATSYTGSVHAWVVNSSDHTAYQVAPGSSSLGYSTVIPGYLLSVVYPSNAIEFQYTITPGGGATYF